MLRVFGKFNMDGGFEMTSQHDLWTGVITVVVLVLFGALVITNHATTGVEAIGTTGLGMLFTYWFTRGGNNMAQTSAPTIVQADPKAVVTETLNQIAQQPVLAGGVAGGVVSAPILQGNTGS